MAARWLNQLELGVPCGATALLNAWLRLYPEHTRDLKRVLAQIHSYLESCGMLGFGYSDVHEAQVAKVLGIRCFEQPPSALNSAKPDCLMLVTVPAFIFAENRSIAKELEALAKKKTQASKWFELIMRHTVLITGHSFFNFSYDNSLPFLPIEAQAFPPQIRNLYPQFRKKYGEKIKLIERGTISKLELERFIIYNKVMVLERQLPSRTKIMQK